MSFPHPLSKRSLSYCFIAWWIAIYAWSIATPVWGAPDEFQHAFRAYAAVRGEVYVKPEAASFGTGGSGAYTYSWNNGATTNAISGVPAGIYTVTVKDANQCIGTKQYEIINPAKVTADIVSFSSYTGFGVSCNGKTDG